MGYGDPAGDDQLMDACREVGRLQAEVERLKERIHKLENKCKRCGAYMENKREQEQGICWNCRECE